MRVTLRQAQGDTSQYEYMKRSERIELFVEVLWKWYARHKRSLPWRDLPDADADVRAYKVLVSEVMLQQTQVPRVIGAYKRFLERFPTVTDLATATNKDVVLAWQGMGYNSRALRLRDAARTIVDRSSFLVFRSTNNEQRTAKNRSIVFPRFLEELISIPGIGHYTASAVRNFAFHLPTPCIDTNIRRVLHRTFVGPENSDGTWKKDDKFLLCLAEEVLAAALEKSEIRISKSETKNVSKIRNSKFEIPSDPSSPLRTSFVLRDSNFHRNTADWHAALMDFGSLVHTKRNPRWDICPLTAGGIIVTTQKRYVAVLEETKNHQPITNNRSREPGRFVGSRFIPNRIFRGKIVQELRETSRELTLEQLGKRVCIDWEPTEHGAWLQTLLDALERDALLTHRGRGYVLRA